MTSVSVVVTAYRRTRYLDGALRSALAQEDLPEEVLVVEDNPPYREPSQEVRGATTIRRFNESLPRVGESLAFGIENASGDAVAFLDDDDRYLPRKVAIVRRIFHEHPEVDFARHSVQYVDEQDRPIPPPYFPARRYPEGPVPPVLSALSRIQVAAHVSSMAIRRRTYLSQLELLRPFRAAPDAGLYWLSQRRRPAPVWYHPQPLVRYRRHPGNMSGRRDEIVRYAEAARHMLATPGGSASAERFARSFERAVRLPLAYRTGRTPTLGDVAGQLWDAGCRLSPFHLRQWALGLVRFVPRKDGTERPGPETAPRRRATPTPSPSGSTPGQERPRRPAPCRRSGRPDVGWRGRADTP